MVASSMSVNTSAKGISKSTVTQHGLKSIRLRAPLPIKFKRKHKNHFFIYLIRNLSRISKILKFLNNFDSFPVKIAF